MKPDNRQPVLIGCSVLQREVELLRSRHWPATQTRWQNSMLHIRPEKLALQLASAIKRETDRDNTAVLVYGDCCLKMETLAGLPGVARTRGKNCYELLLGRELYRRLSHEAVFFLAPEWASRWRHVFEVELGLNQENASGLMRDMHSRLVYLDTGVTPLPQSSLEECSRYCGLELEIKTVSLNHLRTVIADAISCVAGAGEGTR